MIILYIALGAVVGITLLVAMCLIAGLLVALLYELAPVIQAIDIDLSQPAFVTRWRSVKLPEQSAPTVALCRNPVTDAEYFHAVAHGLPMFTKRKGQALTFSIADRLAIEMYFRKFGGEHNVFIVYAECVPSKQTVK